MTTKRYRLPYLESVRTRRHVCFAEQVRSANRAVNKLYSDHLGESDIGIAQLSLLIRLYFFGEVSMAKLACALETDRTTLARNVQLMEHSGHVEVRQGDDRRSRFVVLTDKGFASLEHTLPLWMKAQDDLRRRLGEEAWDDLFKGLRVLASLQQMAAVETPAKRARARR